MTKHPILTLRGCLKNCYTVSQYFRKNASIGRIIIETTRKNVLDPHHADNRSLEGHFCFTLPLGTGCTGFIQRALPDRESFRAYSNFDLLYGTRITNQWNVRDETPPDGWGQIIKSRPLACLTTGIAGRLTSHSFTCHRHYSQCLPLIIKPCVNR